ncbi:hypothetical protein [Kineosporia babensis]|uniref:Uncharacterized protein n=1 Tax=Kineosporia babensis TaxID=499548 RepID=A0A9X1NN30_9ACTN|nr:hypothetical protein [Kineosporia babensis]MCD5316161.1 hypothetical protein [Kineosporia babensis]
MSFADMLDAGISRMTEPAPEVMLERWFMNANPEQARTMAIEHLHRPREHEDLHKWWQNPGSSIHFPTSHADLDQAAYELRGTTHQVKIFSAIQRVEGKVKQGTLGFTHLETSLEAFKAAMLGVYAKRELQIKLLRPARIAGFQGPRWWHSQLPELLK